MTVTIGSRWRSKSTGLIYRVTKIDRERWPFPVVCVADDRKPWESDYIWPLDSLDGVTMEVVSDDAEFKPHVLISL